MNTRNPSHGLQDHARPPPFALQGGTHVLPVAKKGTTDDVERPDIVQLVSGRFNTLPIPPIGDDTKYPPLGGELIPDLNIVVGDVGRPGSGKTTMIFNDIRACAAPALKAKWADDSPFGRRLIRKAQRGTKCIAFSSTHNQDQGWKGIKKYCEMRSIPLVCYDSLYEKRKDGKWHNILEEFMTGVRNEAAKQEKERKKRDMPARAKQVNDRDIITLYPEDNMAPKKELFLIDPLLDENGRRYVPFFVIFDDIAQDLRDNSISIFLRLFRHFRCKVEISSQYFLDAQPAAREIIHMWRMFDGTDDKQLETIYRACNPGIAYDRFLTRYKYCTKGIKNGYFMIFVPDKLMKFYAPGVEKVFKIDSDIPE